MKSSKIATAINTRDLNEFIALNGDKDFNWLKNILSKCDAKTILKIIASLVTSIAVYKTSKMYLQRRKYKHIPGPPTSGIKGFFFGHLNEIAKYREEGKFFGDFLSDAHKKYGKVIQFQAMDNILISTLDRNSIKDILVANISQFPKKDLGNLSIAFPIGTRFFGSGLVTDTDYARWKHRRSVFNHGFQKATLMQFVDQFNVKADMVLERLKSVSATESKNAPSEKYINLFAEFNHATLDAIAQIAFGMNVDSINQVDTELSSTLSKILNRFQVLSRTPMVQFDLTKRHLLNEFRQFIKVVRKTGLGIIEKRLEDIKNGESYQDDILSGILNSWKDGEMDLDVMVDDFVTFFFAGQETTANALAFTFTQLGRNKEIFAKCREEVDRVVGQQSIISYSMINELKYCTWLFKEAMRMFPPVPQLRRTNLNELSIDGVTIPANSNLILSQYCFGRNEEFFPNPTKFEPERFDKEKNGPIENYTYFPFGLGPRNCIGQNFAQIEAVVMIAKMVQHVDIELDPEQELELLLEFTLRPNNGVIAQIKMRS